MFGYPTMSVHGTLPPVPLPRLQAPLRPRQRHHQPEPDSSDSEPQDKDRADLIPQNSGFHVPRPKSRSSLAVSLIFMQHFPPLHKANPNKHFVIPKTPQFSFRTRVAFTTMSSTIKATLSIYPKTTFPCLHTAWRGPTIEREKKKHSRLINVRCKVQFEGDQWTRQLRNQIWDCE